MTKEDILNNTELFLLDLDGTVYLGETPIGDMKRTLARLRAMGKKLVFLTNNSSRTEREYREKLARIGLLGEGDGVFTSGMAAARYLNAFYGGKRVYLLGTAALKAEFAAFGVPLDEHSPEVCVLAYDTELTFAKLRAFDRFLRRGATFIATHADVVCPTEDGSMPDAGSFLALLEKSSGRVPEKIIGKPYAPMAEMLEREYGVPRGKMCMAGDRMYTDIRFANANGIAGLLVLSGETTQQSARDFPDKPDLTLPDLNALFDGD